MSGNAGFPAAPRTMNAGTFRELVHGIKDDNYQVVYRSYQALFDKWAARHRCSSGTSGWYTSCNCQDLFQRYPLKKALGRGLYNKIQEILYAVPHDGVAVLSRTFSSRRSVCQRWNMSAREINERLPTISLGFWSALARCAHKVTAKYAIEGISRQMRRRTMRGSKRPRRQRPQVTIQPRDVTNFADVLEELQNADPRYGTPTYEVHDERCKALELAEYRLSNEMYRLKKRCVRLKRAQDGLASVSYWLGPEDAKRREELYLKKLRLDLLQRQSKERSALLGQHRREINSLYYVRVPQPRIPELRELHREQEERERRLGDEHAKQREELARLEGDGVRVANMMRAQAEKLQAKLERKATRLLPKPSE